MASDDHGHRRHPPAPGLTPATARHLVAATMPDLGAGRAIVRLPGRWATTAEALAAALSDRGLRVDCEALDEASFAALPPEQAARLWVPVPDDSDDDALLVLAGARPWSQSFDDDHLVEIAAMQQREALIEAGRRLLFIEWPWGARRDAEVDLTPEAMAALFDRALAVDYDAMRATNRRLLERLREASDVRVRCPAGTELRVSVAGRRWLPEDCLLGSAEPAIYLPGGEIFVAAVEDSAEGAVAFRHVGEPRIAHFERGVLASVETPSGTADHELAEELGVGLEPLCEVGFGTNPEAPPWQVGALYEKSAGTLHVAVGGNAHFGGRRESPRHMDLIVRHPQVWVDGETLTLPAASWARHPGHGHDPLILRADVEQSDRWQTERDTP